MTGPGAATIAVPSLAELHAAVERAYRLGVSLPDVPLEQFRKEIVGLPRTTEVERLVVQRVGQDIFRDALMEYWEGGCPLTGISDPHCFAHPMSCAGRIARTTPNASM